MRLATTAPRNREVRREKQSWNVAPTGRGILPGNLTKRSRSRKERLSPADKLKQRAGKLSAREKSRLQKEARRAAQKPATKEQAQPKQPQKPTPQPEPTPVPRPQPTRTDEASLAESLASQRLPNWSPSPSIAREYDRIADQIRAELAGKKPELSGHRHLPEGGKPSDVRNETDVTAFPPPQHVTALRPDAVANARLVRQVRPLVNVLRPYLAVNDDEKMPQERLMIGRRLVASGLLKHLAYGETRLFTDQRFTETEQHRDVLLAVVVDTSASMQTDDRLGRAQSLAVLLAECLRECPNVESAFIGYNQGVYPCGDHDDHAIGSLVPSGKTNESAALSHLRGHFQSPRRRKLVLVLSDGLPTDCSVTSVCHLVRSLEKEAGVRFVYGALSSVEHPAYRRRVDLTGAIGPGLVRGLGKVLGAMLR